MGSLNSLLPTFTSTLIFVGTHALWERFSKLLMCKVEANNYVSDRAMRYPATYKFNSECASLLALLWQYQRNLFDVKGSFHQQVYLGLKKDLYRL